MAWCLTKQAESNLRKALRKDGNPQKMVDRGTDGRLIFFTKYVGGENAKRLNYLFETKMLLKSQQRGFVSFIEHMGGSREIKNDFLSKVNRLEKALSNKEVDQFLETFVSQRLKVSVSGEEYKTIVDLSSKLGKLKESFDTENLLWKSEKDGIEFGATQVTLNHFISNLKNPEKPIIEMLKDRGYQFKTEAKDSKARAIIELLLDTAKWIGNNSVVLKASTDLSYMFRQGVDLLLGGHYKIWGKTFVENAKDFVKVVGKKKAEDALMATIFSDPLYLNGEYEKAEIIDRIEEEHPTSLPHRIPVAGTLIKASDVAFTNSGLRVRTELYKKFRDVNIAAGVEMTTEQIKGLGVVINSIAARGKLPHQLNNEVLRLVTWAPKMLKADIDIMTAHSFSKIPKQSRKISRNNLARMVVSIILINAVATLFDDDITEFDPRSSDFLRLKFDDTRSNYLRSKARLISLMAQALTGQYKSATTGEIKEFEPGFGKRTYFDQVMSFFINKTPPATRAFIDITSERDFGGDKPTFSSILVQLGIPITYVNILEVQKFPTLDREFGAVADFFGLSSNSFRDSNKKTGIIPTKKVMKNEDFATMVAVYAKAIGTDPETAFNRIFTGQKIMQVSNGGIIVVDRQDVKDSQAFKKEWVRRHGGNIKDIKQVKLDHTIPNKLGGKEKPSNWQVVPTSVWSSYTKVENALIRGVKNGKIGLKEAQKLIVEFKKINDTKKRKEEGERIIKKLKSLSSLMRGASSILAKISIVDKVMATEQQGGMSIEQQKKFDKIQNRINDLRTLIPRAEKNERGFRVGPWKLFSRGLLSPVDSNIMKGQLKQLTRESAELLRTIKEESKPFYGFAQKRPAVRVRRNVMKASKKYSVSETVISAMLWQENGYENGDSIPVKTEDGKISIDRGIAQINNLAHPEISDQQAHNIEFSIDFMAKEIARNLKYFNGNVNKAIAAYNVGRGGVENNMGQDTPYGGGPKAQKYLDGVGKNMTKEKRKKMGMKVSYD